MSPYLGDVYTTDWPGTPCEFCVSSVKSEPNEEEKMSSCSGFDAEGMQTRDGSMLGM